MVGFLVFGVNVHKKPTPDAGPFYVFSGIVTSPLLHWIIVRAIEKISYISRNEILRALRRILRRDPMPRVRSLTTDNGSEFLDHEAIEALFRSHDAPRLYYTHAYAAWEKCSVENANRLVRRWYPKGTDFSRVSPARIAALESAINSIHRKLLGGQTSQEAYHAAV